MNNYNLVEHDNGPGIAATVVLIAPLPRRRCAPPVECRRYCRANGRDQPCSQGRSQRPQQDARDMIRLLARCGRGWFWELLLWLPVLELARMIGG
jgi:hypothetical protein